MNPERYFQLAFLALFITTLTIAGAGARTAARTHGSSLNQLTNEVRGLIIARATLGLVFYAAVGMWVFAPARWGWTRMGWPATARIAAAILCIPVLIFFRWAFATLGPNYRGGVGLYERHMLVTHGPYRFVRHPIYMSFVALMFLSTLLTDNWLLGLSGVLLVLTIALVRSPVEDRELEGRFGAEWQEYSRRTPAYVPRR